MKYTSQQPFRHARTPRIGILVANLGTPDAPTAAAVRRYLAEFLGDPRVVEIPRLPWWLILHGIILRFRPARVAKAYVSIWSKQGSPLLVHSQAIADALQYKCDAHMATPVHVELAMRYGNPSIPAALQRLRANNVERLLVLPLYPQYSATTTATVFDALSDELKQWRWLPALRMITHYHDQHGYIEALAKQVSESFAQHGQPDRLLFSFHGLPQRYFRAGDPYFCQCQKTARLVAEKLQLDKQRWQVVFQSRFGREPWLQPYADKTLAELPGAGIKHVQIIAPGFAADCLETLEELAMQNREIFLHAGGEQYHYIPALNAQPAHIDALFELVQNDMQGWPLADAVELQHDTAQTLQRAKQLGAVE